MKQQQAIAIVLFNVGVLDFAGKLNHFFKAAVGDLELIVRDALAAKTIAAQAADAQEIAVERDVNVVGPDAGEIEFHYPTVARAVNVGRRVPQTPGRTPVA
jgi:hypothetical protein